MATLTTPDQLLIAMGILCSLTCREAKHRQQILLETWADQRESARNEYVYACVH